MVSNLVGGDAAMIELEQLVAGYDGGSDHPSAERDDMPRQPDGNCWPQWLRKINAAENPRRVSST